MSEQQLGSCIIPTDNVDLLVETKDGIILDVVIAEYDENHMIVDVTDSNGIIYNRDDVNIYTKVLFIPGIGYLPPGTRVIYKGEDYCLCYGWHTNISNQTILSWYLEPLEVNAPMKTLYKEMINDIELVHFR